MLSDKKAGGSHRAPDRRLSENGVWRRKLSPFDVVKIVRTGVHGKGSFKGEIVVRVKLTGPGFMVNWKEEDFLLLFEPIISAVMED